jgi:hypothetical protein
MHPHIDGKASSACPLPETTFLVSCMSLSHASWVKLCAFQSHNPQSLNTLERENMPGNATEETQRIVSRKSCYNKRSACIPICICARIQRSVDSLEEALLDDPETSKMDYEVRNGAAGCQVLMCCIRIFVICSLFVLVQVRVRACPCMHVHAYMLFFLSNARFLYILIYILIYIYIYIYIYIDILIYCMHTCGRSFIP